MRPEPTFDRADPPGQGRGMVRMVINHESAVTDGRGETWLPYVLQDADGRITRLGVIRREALGDCHGDGGAPSGTTRHELPIGAQWPSKTG